MLDNTQEHILTDKTRAAASIPLTGKITSRHRFSSKPVDPVGLLQLANIPHLFRKLGHVSSPNGKP